MEEGLGPLPRVVLRRKRKVTCDECTAKERLLVCRRLGKLKERESASVVNDSEEPAILTVLT